MNDRLEVPKFAGRLRSGSTALRRARETATATAIHLSDPDLAAIHHLATQRGQSEDGCAASILHRALEIETADHGVNRQ
jgi:hypothetical protein